MRLQKLLIQRIDDFGGIEKLTRDLKRLRTLSIEKNWFDNMIIYFNKLFTDEIDVEAFALEYYQSSVDTIAYLKKFNAARKEPTIDFLIDLISFKLKCVSGVKRIS